MIRTIFSTIFIVFVFTGCFSLSFLNPFSSDEDSTNETVQEELQIDEDSLEDAPLWLKEAFLEGNLTALSSAQIKDDTNLSFDRKRALHKAGRVLVKDIFEKSVKIYEEYAIKTNSLKDKKEDIKKLAKQISLKALSKSKDKRSWISPDKKFFILIGVETNYVIELIQNGSKLLFEENDIHFKEFSSNDAKNRIEKLLTK